MELLIRPEYSGDGTSNNIGNIFCVAITVILAALLAVMLMNFGIPEFHIPEEVPCIFKIQNVVSKSPKYESLLYLKNIGDQPYENDELKCEIYINDKPSGCVIETMNGYKFIFTQHNGVKTLSKGGCKDKYWYPRQIIKLDLSNSKIKKGDTIKVNIIWKPEKKILSTDEYYVN